MSLNFNDRKMFSAMPENEMQECRDTGKEVYRALEKYFGNNNEVSYEKILNTLNVSLYYLIAKNVHESNYEYVIQLIYKSLTDNLKKLKNRLEEEKKL